MSQKIKIMKPLPPLSDEEIGSHLDFDGLLEKHRQHISRQRLFRWSFIIATAGVAVLVFWLSETPPSSSPVSKGEPREQSATATDSIVSSGNVNEPALPATDSSVSAAKPAPPRPKERLLKEDKPSTSVEQEQNAKPEIKVTEERDVYLQAEPRNGYPDLYKYFGDNMPSANDRSPVEGTVTVSFVIAANGVPEEIHVNQPVPENLRVAIANLIRNMPPWTPATLNGQAVPSKITIPLTFTTEKISR